VKNEPKVKFVAERPELLNEKTPIEDRINLMRAKPITALVSTHNKATSHKVEKWRMLHPTVRQDEEVSAINRIYEK
jgi:hypothetical protein